ncbi:hypothetical protein ILUMI_05284 [Ignelater luminosus]|uniref:COMM domain-containing protein n=1 Tax=Ignelater luminosus TaxID=2038154 RepID=A0A8K0D7Z2_IGNLU|nr:hypothetical protein ILUMI_05284 [Ignelater luminosus]
MSLSWITINPRLQDGVTLVNSLTTESFIQLLQHITQSKHEHIFTQEQFVKLKESLGLSPTNLNLLIQSIAHIFKQSSKVIIKPTVLQRQLVEDIKFDSEKAEEFVKVWTNTTKDQFENLESLLKLNKVSWELNLQTSSSLHSKQVIPNVRFKLELSNAKVQEHETVVFELNEAELLHMYNTLENIQNKLDIIQHSPK